LGIAVEHESVSTRKMYGMFHGPAWLYHNLKECHALPSMPTFVAFRTVRNASKIWRASCHILSEDRPTFDGLLRFG
jgi:hypothetical protein